MASWTKDDVALHAPFFGIIFLSNGSVGFPGIFDFLDLVFYHRADFEAKGSFMHCSCHERMYCLHISSGVTWKGME